jgi:hypothetical protein
MGRGIDGYLAVTLRRIREVFFFNVSKQFSESAFTVCFLLTLYGCPYDALNVDPGKRLQPSVLQLQVHTIRQFLKLGIRERIRLWLVVERYLLCIRHAFRHDGLHERPFAIGRKKLVVGGLWSKMLTSGPHRIAANSEDFLWTRCDQCIRTGG